MCEDQENQMQRELFLQRSKGIGIGIGIGVGVGMRARGRGEPRVRRRSDGSIAKVESNSIGGKRGLLLERISRLGHHLGSGIRTCYVGAAKMEKTSISTC